MNQITDVLISPKLENHTDFKKSNIFFIILTN